MIFNPKILVLKKKKKKVPELKPKHFNYFKSTKGYG